MSRLISALKRPHVTIARRAEVWLGRNRAHFIHIGKTGGSAVKAALSGAVSETYRVVLHRHSLSIDGVPRGEKCFFFVRDPISRFVSGFYSRQRQGRPLYDYPWSPDEAVAFGRFSTPDELALGLYSADHVLRDESERAMRVIEHVRDSYWKWFGSEATFLDRLDDIVFVGSQEQLGRDFASLKEILGIADTAMLPRDPAKAHRNPEQLDRKLSSESVEHLKRWYAQDYRFLDLVASHFSNVPEYGKGAGLGA